MNPHNWGTNFSMGNFFPYPNSQTRWSYGHWYNQSSPPLNHWNYQNQQRFTRWNNPNSSYGNAYGTSHISQGYPTPGYPYNGNVCAPQKSDNVRPSPRKVRLKQLPFYCEIKRLLTDDLYVAPLFNYSQYYTVKIDRGLGIFSRNDYEILLRMCPLVSGIEQDDFVPPEIKVEINGTPCPIANYKSPLVITEFCRGSNDRTTIKMSSKLGNGQYYLVLVSIMKKKTVKELVKKLKPIERQDAIGFVKKILLREQDEEVSSTVHQCTLTCPLGKMRMTVPSRSDKCRHIQCFDASSYLKMNELNGRWKCPVCHIAALPDSLQRDRLFEDILATADKSVSKINLESDGTWKPALESATEKESSVEIKKGTKRILVIDLVDDDDDDEFTVHENINIKQENESPQNRSPRAKRAKVDTVDQSSKVKEQVVKIRRSRHHRKRRK